MIIDIHGHLGNINQAQFWAADAHELEVHCAEAKVDWLCVSSARSLMYDTVEGNNELDSVLKKSHKLLGYVVVNPVFPETINELQRLKDNAKFRGVKVHPDYHGYNLSSPAVLKFLDLVAEQTGLMLFHVSCMPGTGFAPAIEVAQFAKRHPKTNFILAHMAGIFQNGNYPYFPNLQGCEAVSGLRLKNVFIDTAHYLMYVYPGVMEQMVKLATPGQIVFGTDVPLQGSMQMRFAIEVIQSLKISHSAKAEILGLNAQRILAL